MRILYFAWLREKAGTAEEEITPPPHVGNVAQLVAWLRGRGGGPAVALADLTLVRCAVNQTFASPETVLHPGDEVAFFPPVSGGGR